ncbi:MAG: hypothetical protein ACYDD1_02320 [Caulobacteraceae bacterium]
MLWIAVLLMHFPGQGTDWGSAAAAGQYRYPTEAACTAKLREAVRGLHVRFPTVHGRYACVIRPEDAASATFTRF